MIHHISGSFELHELSVSLFCDFSNKIFIKIFTSSPSNNIAKPAPIKKHFPGEILSIYPDGSISYDGKDLEHGFIVDNKVFVVDEGGVDSFFNNTGNV